MKNLLKAIYSGEPPYLNVLEYIGKSFESITSLHTDFCEMPCDDSQQERILEIRLKNATLSCIFKDNICVNAYKFTDD